MPTLNASVILQLQYFKEPNFTVHNPVPTYAGSNRYTPRAAAIAGLLKPYYMSFLSLLTYAPILHRPRSSGYRKAEFPLKAAAGPFSDP